MIFWYFIAGDTKYRVAISNFYFDIAGCSSSTYLVYALLSTYQQEDELNVSPWQSRAAVNVLVLLDLKLLNGSLVQTGGTYLSSSRLIKFYLEGLLSDFQIRSLQLKC